MVSCAIYLRWYPSCGGQAVRSPFDSSPRCYTCTPRTIFCAHATCRSVMLEAQTREFRNFAVQRSTRRRGSCCSSTTSLANLTLLCLCQGTRTKHSSCTPCIPTLMFMRDRAVDNSCCPHSHHPTFVIRRDRDLPLCTKGVNACIRRSRQREREAARAVLIRPYASLQRASSSVRMTSPSPSARKKKRARRNSGGGHKSTSPAEAAAAATTTEPGGGSEGGRSPPPSYSTAVKPARTVSLEGSSEKAGGARGKRRRPAASQGDAVVLARRGPLDGRRSNGACVLESVSGG